MTLIVRPLGLQDYLSCWKAMQDFTQKRDETTADEIWLVEHPPVFTQGQNGQPEHILNPGSIPVINVDRGGQVTYHGPGQLVIYTLINLHRKKWTIRDLIICLENAMIKLLADYGINATSKREAPGVYIEEKKIGSLGLRVKRGCAYHGLAFNVHMDLSPFLGINPCGYKNRSVTQLTDWIQKPSPSLFEEVSRRLILILNQGLALGENGLS